jgi:hypothetical protein
MTVLLMKRSSLVIFFKLDDYLITGPVFKWRRHVNTGLVKGIQIPDFDLSGI